MEWRHELYIGSIEVSNFVFDENGKEVYKNIPSGKIFESINQLIDYSINH